MADITTFLIGLAVCIAVAVGLTILQLKLRKRNEEKERNQAKKSAANEKFEVGKIYQMPDKSLAKYIGDNKFLKVKMK